MVLLTTRRTKEKLERALDLSKKKENDAFKDVAMLERAVENSIDRNLNSGMVEIML